MAFDAKSDRICKFILIMSYTELSDKFEFITSHIKKGPQIGGALCNLFKNYKKSLDLFSQQTLKNIDVFTADLPKDISSTTLEYALSSLISHFKKFAHQQSAFSRHFQTEVIDPLESFIVQNHDSNMNHLNKAAPHYKKLQKSIDNMQKLKEKHLQKSGESEKIEKLVDRNDHSKEQQKLYKNALQAKSNSFKASEIYEKSVQEANKLWDEYNSVMPGVLDGFQQNEESRIHFFKYSIEKYTNYYAKFSLNVTGIFEELNAALSNVDSEIDVKEFVEANKSKVIKKQEEFVSYEFYKRSKAFGIKSDQFNESEYEMLDDAGIQTGNDPDLELVKTVLNYLIPYRIDRLRDSVFTIDVPAEEEKEPNIDASYYGKLSELLHTVEGRELFCDVLESKNSNRCLEYSKITQLAALIKSLLTAMMMETDTDPITFCKLITFSDKFYTETPDDKKQFLSNLISSHCVWSDTNRWTQAIICAIQAKLEADGENSQQLGKRRKTGLFTTIKIIAKRIPAIFQKNLADERAEKAASFLVISQFNYHMIKLGVPVDTANSIILQVCQNVNLDPERTCLLLSEVLNTKRTSMMIEPDFSSSLKAREKERQKYGNLLQIGLALEFLEPKDCYALLLVCKQ